MRLSIGKYDVDIEAKFSDEESFNEEAARSLLNDLSIYLWRAHSDYANDKLYTCAEYLKDISQQLFDIIHKTLYYEDEVKCND